MKYKVWEVECLEEDAEIIDEDSPEEAAEQFVRNNYNECDLDEMGNEVVVMVKNTQDGSIHKISVEAEITLIYYTNKIG
jgi:hypothetical protein